MKIAFTTVDLFPGREHLMPWRTVLEISKGLKDEGWTVEVLNNLVSDDCKDYVYEGVNIVKAPREIEAFCDYVNKGGYDVLLYPMPWREALKNLSAFKTLQCKKIAYVPGGIYGLKNVLTLYKRAGMAIAKPWLLDWVTPNSLVAQRLKSYGFDAAIGQSPLTTETFKKGGFLNAVCMLPGKDPFELLEDNDEILSRFGLNGKKFLLFTGAPAPIRGVHMLLDAFERWQTIDSNAELVLLMRKDVGSNYDAIEKRCKEINNPRLHLITERVSRNELKTLMKAAYGAVLPFIIAPSEIPLTYFELLQVGTPIVTFQNGGTTDYLKDALLIAKPGNVNQFAQLMSKMWNERELHNHLRQEGLNLMEKHPTWDEIVKKWKYLIQNL